MFEKLKQFNFITKISQLLSEVEKKIYVIERKVQTQNFQSNNDFETLLIQTLPLRQNEERYTNFFAALKSHFEVGFQFERDQKNWRPVRFFAFGELLPAAQLPTEGHIFLPATRPGQVQTSRGPAFLAKLGLKTSPELEESSAFLLRPSLDVAYVLISAKPSPWLTQHIEETRWLIEQIFNYRRDNFDSALTSHLNDSENHSVLIEKE